MRKMLLTALLGLGLVLASGSQASAWSKFNWGAGFNVAWEGGGNSVLWGLFKGENIPNMGMGGMDMGAPMMGGDMGHGPAMPPTGHGSLPDSGTPKNFPSSMPRADAQPVGYFQPGQAQQAPMTQTPSDFYAPSYWYGR